jgi:hypothetical protein
MFLTGKGGRGGNGAPRAGTQEAILLMLAMASGLPVKAAVHFAADLAPAPMASAVLLSSDASGSISQDPHPGLAAEDAVPFGRMLERFVEAFRDGLSVENCYAQQIVFSIGAPAIYAELHSRGFPAENGSCGWVVFSYARVRVSAPAVAPHAGVTQRFLPVSLLVEIAKLVGTPSEASAADDDNDDDTATLEPLLTPWERPHGSA